MQPAVTPVAGRLVEQQREPSAQVPQCHPHRAPRWRDKAADRVVGTFPNKNGIVRFVGAIFLERNDERAGGSGPRYMRLETIAPMIYDSVVGLPAVAS